LYVYKFSDEEGASASTRVNYPVYSVFPGVKDEPGVGRVVKKETGCVGKTKHVVVNVVAKRGAARFRRD
jgi:hypothetical protein